MIIHVAIAIIPVAIYLLLIGALRLRTRPLLTSGWRDTLTLGIAAAGLVAVGPMQLFMPPQAVERWHAWVWLMLLGLYLLTLVMVLLNSKPRLIAYGLTEPQFRSVLLEAAQQVDPTSQWDGEVLNLPNCSMQVAMEGTGSAHVHQVAHVGLLRNVDRWFELERNFVRLGGVVNCPRSLSGIPIVLAGIIFLLAGIIPLVTYPDAALAQLQNFLTR